MKRSVLLGMVAGAVVIVLAWYALLYSPAKSDLSKQQKALADATSHHTDLQVTLARLKDLDKNRPKQQAVLAALNKDVPQTPDLAGFIVEANNIAAQSGVSWLSVSPGVPAASTSGGPTTISLSIQIQGGYYQVVSYLQLLEQDPRLVVVDSVSISSGSGGSAGAAASGAAGAAAAPSAPSATAAGSDGSPPTLNVTLTARMFTRAAPASGSTGSGGAGSTPSAPAPTTPTTPPATSSGSKPAGVS